MALTHIGLGGYVSLLQDLTTKHRKTFLAIDEIAGLMPKVERTFQNLVLARSATQRSDDPALLRQLAEAVSKHDNAVRALALAFDTAIAIERTNDTPDDAAMDSIEGLRKSMLPDGLATIQKTYLEMGGLAATAQHALTPAIKRQLSALVVGNDVTAMDLVKRYIKHGTEVGRLESDKNDAPAAGRKQAAEPVPTIAAARTAAVALLSSILTLLSHSDAPEEKTAAIAGPIRLAADRAGARKANASKSKEEGEEGGEGEEGEGGEEPADGTPEGDAEKPAEGAKKENGNGGEKKKKS